MPKELNDTDELAFPHEELNSEGRPYIRHYGLTKREYFAGQMMAALVLRLGVDESFAMEHRAREAVQAADVLIKELNE